MFHSEVIRDQRAKVRIYPGKRFFAFSPRLGPIQGYFHQKPPISPIYLHALLTILGPDARRATATWQSRIGTVPKDSQCINLRYIIFTANRNQIKAVKVDSCAI